MNYVIEIVDYAVAKSGTAIHTIDIYIDVDLDGEKINGLEYYSQIARKCVLELYVDDWIRDNLVPGINADNIIPKSDEIGDKYWKYVFRIKESDEIRYIGYLHADSIEDDTDDDVIIVNLVDIMEVLKTRGDRFKQFSPLPKNIKELLVDLIDESFTGWGGQNPTINFDLDVYDDYDPQVGWDVTDHAIYSGNFSEWQPATGLGSADLKKSWRNIYYDESGDLNVVMSKSWEKEDHETGLWNQVLFKLHFKIRDSIIIDGSSEIVEYRIVLSQESYLYDSFYVDAGYPESNNLTLDTEFGIYTLTDDVRYTGLVAFENVIFVIAEGDIWAKHKYWTVIKKLLTLNNLALHVKNNGDLHIVNKTGYSTSFPEVVITKDYIQKRKSKHILQDPPDFSTFFNIFDDNVEGDATIGDALNIYMQGLFETLGKEEQLEIVKDPFNPLNLLQKIIMLNRDGRLHDFVVVNIKPEDDEEEVYYKITAWTLGTSKEPEFDIEELLVLDHVGTNSYNSLVIIDPTHFILMYAGFSDDGWIKTFEITDTAITQIASLEFDTVLGRWNSLVMVSPTLFVGSHRGGVGSNYAYLKSFTIDSNYENITIKNSFLYDSNGIGASVVLIDPTHIIVAYAGAFQNGKIRTFVMDADGDNIASIHTIQHNFNAEYNSMVQISTYRYLVAFHNNSGDGELKVFSIDGSFGSITEVSNLVHDTDNGTFNSLFKIDVTHYILAYTGNGGVGIIKTILIDPSDSYAISVIDTLQHDTVNGHNSLRKINSSNYILACSGVDDDGFIKLLRIDENYHITLTKTLEHDMDHGTFSSLVQIDQLNYALAYAGSSEKGYIKKFGLDMGV